MASTGGDSTGAAPAAIAPGQRERRLVSILFADLVGFTAAADGRDPEQTRDFQERYFALCREVIERYGGTVEKFIGDAVMAVWGAPSAREDDAERAVRAALDLLDAVRRLHGTGGATIEARAAVVSGEAAVDVGAQGHGMVAGDVVNTAARLQALADPGTVLVGEGTRQAASESIVFEPIGDQAVRGKTLPVPASRALRIVAGRGGSGRSSAVEPPFVGRDAELTLLKDLFVATSRERRLRLISVTGQAGIGKSRLAWEFEKYVDGVVEAVYWHHGRSPAYGEGITFWALGEMVRRRAGIAEGDDESETRRKLAETLETFVPDADERTWMESKLLPLLGVDEGAGGGSDRGELFAAWRTFFERVAVRGATVLVFEDLQWADPGLIDFIEHVLEWSRNHPILVITLSRPELLERRPSWGAGQRNFTNVHLEPLPNHAMRALLAGLVPGLPETAIRAILQRAEGVPLYGVETVRMLVDDGSLVAEEASYRVARALDQLSVPPTLHALVAARLDACDPQDRALLQAASVLGHSFSVTALSAVTGQSQEQLEPRLGPLVRAELLTLETDPRSPERGQYQFVQSTLLEVAYSTLAKRDRRERHVAAARHFESLGDDALAGALAEHYYAAYQSTTDPSEAETLAAQARVALRAAAQRAQAIGSPDHAMAYFDRAVSVTRQPGEQAALLERAGGAAINAGRYDDALRLFERAEAAYRAAGDAGSAQAAVAGIGRALLNAGRVVEALERLQPAADALDDSVDERGTATLLAQLARAYMLNHEAKPALEAADRALLIAERHDFVDVVADVLVTKGTALARTRTREGAALLAGALELARSRDLTAVEDRALNNLALFVESDDPRGAEELAGRGIALARRIGSMDLLANFASRQAFFRFQAGDLDEALAAVRDLDPEVLGPLGTMQLSWSLEAVGIMQGRADVFEQSRILRDRVLSGITNPEFLAGDLSSRAVFALFRGDPDAAAPFAHKYRDSDAEPFWGHDLWGHVAVRRLDRNALAESLAALETAPRHGRLGEAHLYGLRASLAQLDGQPEEAARLQHEAERRFRELNQGLTLAEHQLERAIVLSGTPEGRASAQRAREAFLRMGAVSYVRVVDELLAAWGSGEGTASARSSPMVATDAER